MERFEGWEDWHGEHRRERKMSRDKVQPPTPANDDLAHNAQRALAMKKSAPQPARPVSQTPGLGMVPHPNEATQHQLSLDSEGVKPVMQPHKGK